MSPPNAAASTSTTKKRGMMRPPSFKKATTSNKNKKQSGGGFTSRSSTKASNTSLVRRGNKRELIFDPEARKAHLQGFSERKRQRRAFGLAMQKVKDRKAKLEQRKEEKKDELQRIEQAEQQKEDLLEEQFLHSQLRFHGIKKKSKVVDDESDDSENDGNDDGQVDSKKDKEKGTVTGAAKRKREEPEEDSAIILKKTYDDQQTEAHWGGHVTVAVSAIELDAGGSDDDEEDEEEDSTRDGRRSKSTKTAGAGDVQQRMAGSVEKYMHQLKGKMPAKKKSNCQASSKRKGKNGAADMKGIGSGAHLKMAQKVLSKTKANQQKGKRGKGGGAGGGDGGKKRKRGGKR